jgi:hypothetical protein
LAGNGGNRLATGQAVTDGRTDGASRQSQSTTNHGSRQLDRLVCLVQCCHYSSLDLLDIS